MKVSVSKVKKEIPTYIPGDPIEFPMFFEKKPYQGASGRLYPLPYTDSISDEKKDVSYDVFRLENEYVMTEVLPALGGKILRGYDKVTDYDFIYHNEVIKPALVGLGGPWISGGIEFNWPQHHRPTTYSPLEAVIENNADGSKTVWTGEVEPFYRMKAMAGITLDPGRSYIKAKVRIYNRTSQPQIFMWWANLAVPVNKDYRTIFPPDVEWVNDHDRRAVLEWPIAKGVYDTARPFDYGNGTDISKYDSVIVPSSFLVSQGQSDMDFVAGYDSSIEKGIVTVSEHHLAPGKKMWTWGHGDFGDMWCSNLTDSNGPYIELMTGVYTDNQPDFTWIAPYETKEFEQYWYPIHDIKDVKNATIDAALNMEAKGDELFIAFCVTGLFKNCRLCIEDGDELLFEEILDADPKHAYKNSIPIKGHNYNDICCSIYDEGGKCLVSYKPYIRGQKQPIEVRKPVLRPSEYDTVEELYINGYHLEQYKQHNYDPRDYYMEGLRRDPGDIRCNTSMARLALKDGKFKEAINYCDKAIARLTSRNQHPSDTEAFYVKGLALCYLDKFDEAYEILYKAAWNYSHRCASYYKLAQIDCLNGKLSDAIQKAEISYGLNSGHFNAKLLEAAIYRHLGESEKALSLAQEVLASDKLELWAYIEASFISGEADKAIYDIWHNKPEAFLDVTVSYMETGFYEDALKVLELVKEDYPLFAYYKAYILNLLGRDNASILEEARLSDTGLCFPSRLEDIKVLSYAEKADKADANACYYLGSLFYDRFRYDDAIEYFEKAIEREPLHYKALRNLSLAYFDKKHDPAAAKICLEKALSIHPDPRLLLEYQQLLKNMNYAPEERLRIYDKYPELLAKRDDCYLDKISLLSMEGRYEEAISLAKCKHFHIYEGGEGKLTKQHAWMHVLYALELMDKGELEKASLILHNGIDMPKSYGEAKTYFNQEAHIYYYLGLLSERAGHKDTEAFEQAAVYKAAVSEISLFRALALQKLMHFSEARAVLDEMLEKGESLIINKDMRSYYGVGSPSPMPFEYDIEKINTVDGHILKAYAYLGLGHINKADASIKAAAELDPYNFSIYAFKHIKDHIYQ